MTKQLRKLLALIIAIALAVACTALAFAEEEVPASDEVPAAEEVSAADAVPAEEASDENASEAPVEAVPAAEAEPAAEEPTAEEPAAEPAGETDPSYTIVEETPAAAEPAAEVPAEEPAQAAENTAEPVPEEPAAQPEVVSGTEEEIEICEGEQGSGDPEITEEMIPGSNEPNFADYSELKLNETVSGSIDAITEGKYFIRCGSSKIIVLELRAATEDVSVKINGKTVKFEKAEQNEDTGIYCFTYEMSITASQDYTVVLSSSNPVSYKLTAEEVIAEEEAFAEETAAESGESDAEVITEETAGEETNTEENPEAETDGALITAEETETDESGIGTEETGNTETETNEDDEESDEEEIPAMKGWITVEAESFEIGSMITLKAESDTELNNMVVWQTEVRNEAGETAWQNIGYGELLTIELTEANITGAFRFRMEDGNFSEQFVMSIPEGREEEENEAEDPAEESEEFVLPENRSVSFDIFWDGEAVLGETAHFRATLIGYEGLDYTIQWQQSADETEWVDIEGENGETMDVLATEESNSLFYRVTVIIHLPDEYVPQEEAVPQE